MAAAEPSDDLKAFHLRQAAAVSRKEGGGEKGFAQQLTSPRAAAESFPQHIFTTRH